MANDCVRTLMEQGFTSWKARARCKELYKSKVTPGIGYRSIVPGAKTTAGRKAYEKLLLEKRRRQERRRYRGIPRG